MVPGVAGSNPVTHPRFSEIEPPAVANSVADSAEQPGGGPPKASPRSGLVRALAEAVAEATASGDSKAARVALAALGQLVGDDGAGASDRGVIDLAAERRKRGEG